MRTVATCILLTVLVPALVCGQTLVTTGTVPETFGSWERSVQIDPFDPALGDLVAVQFLVEGRFDGWVYHENQSYEPSDYSDSLERTLSVSMDLPSRGDDLMRFDDSVVLSGDLQSYDGLDDYDGESGVQHRVYTPISGEILIEMPAAADFVGQSALTVDLASNSDIVLDMATDGMSVSRSSCEANVIVTYVFCPALIGNENAAWGEVKTLFR